jgi:hypothetical protein
MMQILHDRLRRSAAAIILAGMALLLPGTVLAQTCGPFPPYLSPHDRFGFNVVYDNRCVTSDQPTVMNDEGTPVPSAPCVSDQLVEIVPSNEPLSLYNLSRLKAGWFIDYQMETGPVQGLSYVPVIRVGELLDGNKVSKERFDRFAGPAIDALPSRLWTVGNETDRAGQDNRPPDLYAEDYYWIRQWIRQRDPTAKVAIGAIVQPTPRRIEYLKIVLRAYRNKFGADLPTDAFTIHSFILTEDPNIGGAGLPPQPFDTSRYSYSTSPTYYSYDDHGDIEIFKQRIQRFRAWMANTEISGYRNYRNVPLIITEYGILFGPDTFFKTGDQIFPSPSPPEVCNETDPAQPKYRLPDGNAADNVCFFTLTFARNYMLGSLEFLRTATSGTTGLTSDGNRLVQAASWFSLQDQLRHSLYQVDGFNGNLVDRDTATYRSVYPPYSGSGTPTPTPSLLLGPAFRDHITSTVGYNDYVALSLLPQPNAKLTVQPSTIVYGDTGSVKFTVTVRNRGNIQASPVLLFNTAFNDLPGCSTAAMPPNPTVRARCNPDRVVSLTCDVSGLEPDSYEITAKVEAIALELGGADDNLAGGFLNVVTPSPTPTPTPTPTRTPTPTLTPTNTPTLRPDETRLPPTNTPTPTPTLTPTPTTTSTPTLTPTTRPPRTPVATEDPFQRTYLPEIQR